MYNLFTEQLTRIFVAVSDAYMDQNNNIYICGVLSGSYDIDPGAGVTTLTSQGSTDIYFAKFNSAGQLLMARSFGGVDADQVDKILVDSQGDIYLYGSLANTMDFDPGAGTDSRTPLGSDIYLAKYSSSGNLIRVDTYGFNDNFASITTDRLLIDEDDNIYISGSFAGTYDFDPGVGDQSLTSLRFSPSCSGFCRFAQEYFIAAYNSNGSLNYVNTFTTGDELSHFIPNDVLVTNRQVWMVGPTNILRLNIDLDPDDNNTVSSSTIGANSFIAKYGQNGNYVTAEHIDMSVNINNVSILDNNDIMIIGNFNNSVDFDFNIATNEFRTAAGTSTDIFLAVYDQNLNYKYVYDIGSTDVEDIDFGLSYGYKDVVIASNFTSFTEIDPFRKVDITTNGFADVYLARFRLRPKDAGAFPDNLDKCLCFSY